MVAIPLLAALVALNWQEAFRRRMAKSAIVSVTQVVAQSCAFIGVVAGFWHILWVVGVVMLASGLVAVLVHSTGYWRPECDRMTAPRNPRSPATPGVAHSSAAPKKSNASAVPPSPPLP